MLPFLFGVVPSLRHNHGVEGRARCLRHKVFALVCALFAASSAVADRYERFSAWSASHDLVFQLDHLLVVLYSELGGSHCNGWRWH